MCSSGLILSSSGPVCSDFIFKGKTIQSLSKSLSLTQSYIFCAEGLSWMSSSLIINTFWNTGQRTVFEVDSRGSSLPLGSWNGTYCQMCENILGHGLCDVMFALNDHEAAGCVTFCYKNIHTANVSLYLYYCNFSFVYITLQGVITNAAFSHIDTRNY